MKIAVLGANGKSGGFIVDELIHQGYEPTAIVRNKDTYQGNAKHILVKDVFNLTQNDILDYDVVINALGFFTEATLKNHLESTKHLISILEGLDTRLMVVGGAGSLFVDNDETIRLMDTPDFPSDYKPLAVAMSEAFDYLKTVNDVNWTYLSPSAFFDFEGDRLGHYRLGGNQLLVNDAGESRISYADYAIAMVDEIKNQKYNGQRFTVGE